MRPQRRTYTGLSSKPQAASTKEVSRRTPTNLSRKREDPYYAKEAPDGYNSVEDARIKALDNMKNHEALYMEFLENLSGKQSSREDELKKEKAKIEELIHKNCKVVLKLVGSYFEELKEQWTANYYNIVQEKILGNISQHAKKARQKLCKIRKISESFVSGNFEEDLLTYALEKDLDETLRNIKKSSADIEYWFSKNAQSSVGEL